MKKKLQVAMAEARNQASTATAELARRRRLQAEVGTLYAARCAGTRDLRQCVVMIAFDLIDRIHKA